MTPKEREIEYITIAYISKMLANMCAGNPERIIDKLTGYLWDEEEAGLIKKVI